MAKEIMYRQCTLEYEKENGVIVRTVSWIPEIKHGKKISVGSIVTLIDHVTNNSIQGSWTVVSVSDYSITESLAKARAHDWHKHRKFTDV